MDLLKRIENDFKQAAHSRDVLKLSALRNVRAALHYKEIELKPKDEKLTNEVIIGVIQSLVKKHKESIEVFKKGKRDDLLQKEIKELDVLSAYLPEQVSDDKIKAIVMRVIENEGAHEPQDLGKVMASVMKELKGKADGNKVREIAQKQLTPKGVIPSMGEGSPKGVIPSMGEGSPKGVIPSRGEGSH